MKVSIKWLNEYIDMSGIEVDDLCERLTMAGLEVEDIIKLEPVVNIVTAKVLAKEKHPDADKLSVCTVTDGTEEYPVVCGAPNVAEGQIIPFAKVGAVLPGDFKIKKSKIRGELSMGMICSASELGLEEGKSNGILVLPEDLELGLDINDVIGLGDTVLDVYITPNRADCLSVYGLAREIAAIYNLDIQYDGFEFNEVEEKAEDVRFVKVLDGVDCPLYQARVIKGVKIQPSPLWMQNKLRAVGVRPINNIVDITNYVNFEFGQPLHTFDLREIEGGIIVRKAEEGEKLLTLDKKERELKSHMLVIADEKKPLAVAGVMGGEHSGIQDDTADVLLECAYFKPESVRLTARKLGMQTDSSYRYERGIDYAKTEEMVDYAAYLIQKLAGGDILSGVVRDGGDMPVPPAFKFSVEKINAFLGTDIPESEMISILNRLEIEPAKDGDEYSVISPSFRVDIERWQDISEEVARIYGYDKIPTTVAYISSDSKPMRGMLAMRRRMQNELSSLGFFEAVNYSFMSEDYLRKFDKDAKFVKLKNPISEDMNAMRTFVFPGVLENIRHNLNNGYKNISVFETANTFIDKGEKIPEQKLSLALGVSGDFWPLSWNTKLTTELFFALKGVLENVLSKEGVAAEYVRSERPFLHPGKSADIVVDGVSYGFIGEIHPALVEELDLKEKVCIAEIRLEELIGDAKRTFKYKPFSKLPSIYKDISIIVDKNVESENMRLTAEEMSGLIESVTLYDVYDGKGVEDGKVSLAYRIYFSDMEKTLTDEETNSVVNNIIEKLDSEFGAKLR